MSEEQIQELIVIRNKLLDGIDEKDYLKATMQVNKIDNFIYYAKKANENSAKSEQALPIPDVSNSVFIVCENDDYGRDLYLCTTNTKEKAEEVRGRDNTRHIYEHTVTETDC